MTHPITPPPELVRQWFLDAQRNQDPEVMCWMQATATRAAQWGADQELEACCAIALTDPVCGTKHQRSMLVQNMREQRRPKPPSLKEQALKAARIELLEGGKNAELILRALEALPDE